VTNGIIKGEDYAFRYRGINAVGPGPWSEIVILKAATIPLNPGKPYYISSNSTSITLGLPETTDNGGSKIRAYRLFRDGGDLSTDINIEDINYNGFDTVYTVKNLTPGKVYRFIHYAVNDFG
jgi:hypothetical protein